MLPNEKFALACRQKYAESGDLIDKDNGVFAHCPVPECEGGTEGLYLTFDDHQNQGLLQSVDFDRMCFFPSDVKHWLQTCSEFPDDYFKLWDIFDHYVKEHQKSGGNKLKELEKGIFDSTRRKEWSHVYRNNALRVGKENARLLRGVCNPNTRQKVKDLLSLPVESVEPNGSTKRFYSASEAGRYYGIGQPTVCRCASRGTPITRGKFQGFLFRYI
jgi:hypothetical protein